MSSFSSIRQGAFTCETTRVWAGAVLQEKTCNVKVAQLTGFGKWLQGPLDVFDTDSLLQQKLRHVYITSEYSDIEGMSFTTCWLPSIVQDELHYFIFLGNNSLRESVATRPLIVDVRSLFEQVRSNVELAVFDCHHQRGPSTVLTDCSCSIHVSAGLDKSLAYVNMAHKASVHERKFLCVNSFRSNTRCKEQFQDFHITMNARKRDASLYWMSFQCMHLDGAGRRGLTRTRTILQQKPDTLYMAFH
mmetsp:Transcript_15392/g.38919  ORF Transcript_15392/g.38919 Transcript_15392/m.38919 type:complete len:246 (-) Transcript_15392:915-1652(-)